MAAFVSEQIIDGILDRFERDPDSLANTYKELAAEQPAVIALLYSRDMHLLTEKELDLLFFIVAVVYRAFATLGPVVEATREALSRADEHNWERMLGMRKGSFRDRVTPFFENYLQEDLLAFVEDSLVVDEDDFLTSIGREVIFVTAKTVIDVWDG